MKNEIKKLRKEGKSYGQIASKLNCSKSLVAYHLSEKQKEKTLQRQKERRKNIKLGKPTVKQKVFKCKKCQKILGYTRKEIGQKTLCENCNPNYVDWSKITLKQIKDKSKNINQYHSRLRSLSRTVYKNSTKPKKCYCCDYDKHYEVCHIKDIKSFDENCFVSDVNDITNLVALCPNCHWEFDNNLLKLT